MSNSKLVDYTLISPHKNSPRRDKIKKITIHHMAGNLSVEQCGSVFQTREASSNYGIGSDGRVGMYVEEKDRSWCSANGENDHQAITIEVANDKKAPTWHVSDKAIAKLIDLCTDICERNGIAKLNYTGHKTGNVTLHKWFAPTLCPGPYLENKVPYICEEVNKRLVKDNNVPAKTKTLYRVRKTWADEKSQIGAYSSLANAKKLVDKNKGYNVYDENGNAVYPTVTAKKSNETIAKEVIAGKWGNGTQRREKLTAAGYDYATIQALVNKLLK